MLYENLEIWRLTNQVRADKLDRPLEHNLNNGEPIVYIQTVDASLTRVINTFNTKRTRDDGSPCSPDEIDACYWDYAD